MESHLVSVIVPTLNEVDNIDALLRAVLAQSTPELGLEILVADGGSTDGTAERVLAWQAKAPVRLVRGGAGQGLAGDVLFAAEQASSIIVVMDADLSHPPSSIPQLVAPIIAGTSDMVIGSRYAPGGSIPQWPLARRLLSRFGGALAWPLADIRDPMSGFFALHRDRLLTVDSRAAGFKIGLEVMAAAGDGLRVTEVPISFTDRTRGASKIGFKQITTYAQRLFALAGGTVSVGTAARFSLVGLMGLVIDYAVFMALFASGFAITQAHVTSFFLATLFNYVLNSRWSFAAASPVRLNWQQYAQFLTVCLMALFLRGGVLASTMDAWGSPPQLAILFAIAAGAVVNFLGSAFFVFPGRNAHVSKAVRWRVAALGVVAYALVLRVIYAGALDLLPQEAYYWNYAQQLDFGYLDHPPLVAWLISLFTQLAGDTEMAVRAGALLCWLVTALFVYQLTRNLYDKTAAFVALMLLSVFPFFFLTGVLMTPDAPLTAAWAGSLYFLERALLAENRRAWLGVGLCIGLGMLSKYTIVLLAPATLLLLLLHPGMRSWLWRPEPYLSAVVALLLFSPVLIWNAHNEWASFFFQSTDRLARPMQFSLHLLAGSMLVLLTPIGLAAAAGALSSRDGPAARSWLADRRSAFTVIYTLMPLSVFVAFSLFHEVKLNWTGPVWLAVIPAIAWKLVSVEKGILSAGLRRIWAATVVLSLLLYGTGLHYLALGLPGIGYSQVPFLKALPHGWKEFGAEMEKIETEFEDMTGNTPLIVGMDRYFLSSQMAFYDPDGDTVDNTAGRSLFGMDAVMYGRWVNPDQAAGHDIVLVSRQPWGAIDARQLPSYFRKLGPIQERVIKKADVTLGSFYYRIGYNYSAPSSSVGLVSTAKQHRNEHRR